MVERYLGKEAADDIFMSALLTGLLPEKQACDMMGGIEKDASPLATILAGLKMGKDGLVNVFKGGTHALDKTFEYGADSAKALGLLAALGGAAGVLGSSAYDILKERVTQEDPEAKFNDDIEAMYANKTRELSDARWMDRVRAMRDDLKRGYKKMPTEEYAVKYKALQDALDERKG